MTNASQWRAVDACFTETIVAPDRALEEALAANAAAGLPSIDVSALQGKLIHLLARMTGARKALGIGALGGYSTIWLARALPTTASSSPWSLTSGTPRSRSKISRAQVSPAKSG
jgi:predicted O-methyltransferase YrrM